MKTFLERGFGNVGFFIPYEIMPSSSCCYFCYSIADVTNMQNFHMFQINIL